MKKIQVAGVHSGKCSVIPLMDSNKSLHLSLSEHWVLAHFALELCIRRGVQCGGTAVQVFNVVRLKRKGIGRCDLEKHAMHARPVA